MNTSDNGQLTPAAVQALSYLQTQVSEVVNHDDEQESKVFRELTMHLFQWSTAIEGNSASGIKTGHIVKPASGSSSGAPAGGLVFNPASNESKALKDIYLMRTELYESLLEYFPDSMREPKDNLVDLVPMG